MSVYLLPRWQWLPVWIWIWRGRNTKRLGISVASRRGGYKGWIVWPLPITKYKGD